MRNSMTIKFAPGTIRKLKGEIIKGINEGAIKFVQDLKTDLINRQPPDVWSATGPMADQLANTGLNEFTHPGKLAAAWLETISDIKIDKRYNSVVMNLFNSKVLDEQTVWIGLQKRPKDFKPKFATRENTRKRKSRAQAAAIFNGGYRPIGRGKGQGWTWELNPYPDNGYWLLYEQGWGAYQPHNFIKDAYYNAFGMSSANLFGEMGDVAFDNNAIANMTSLIVNTINGY